MNVIIYGFAIDRAKLPDKMSPDDMFLAIESNGGKTVDRKGLIRTSATTVTLKYDGQDEDWWAGMILRAKDVASFNHLIEDNGKLTLTSTELSEGKIAEVAFFVANKSTGSGLLASYHGAPGLPIFKVLARRLFNARRKERYMQELEHVKGKAKKALHDAYKGDLVISQLVRTDSLKDLLKELKKVDSFEARYTSVATGAEKFSLLRAKSSTQALKLAFPSDFTFDDALANELVQEIAADAALFVKVKGADQSGDPAVVSTDLAQNKMIFGVEDYVKLLGGLSLDLTDWAPTISKSSVVKWLLREANSGSTRVKLTT